MLKPYRMAEGEQRGFGSVLLPSSSFAQQGPKAQVKRTIEKVLDILGDPSLKSPEKEEVRLVRKMRVKQKAEVVNSSSAPKE